MKKLILALIVTMATLTVTAQRYLYTCSDYTSTGEPIGVSTSWTINPTGGACTSFFKMALPLKKRR